jgi:hypothetical protein
MHNQQPTRTILILSANPEGTTRLRLDKEVSAIKKGLQRSRYRDYFVIEQAEAVTWRDMQRAMLDYNPQIVHFCGHGEGAEGLVFEVEGGKHEFVSADVLAELFSLFADQVECVLLNACYSEVQAEAIARHVRAVIGMRRAIGDSAAIEFAVSFYDALGAGRPIEFAHKLGCINLKPAKFAQDMIPALKQKSKPPLTETTDQAGIEAITTQKQVFISYKRDVAPDETVALEIFRALDSRHEVFIDQTMLVGTSWAERIETEIRKADAIIVLLSERSVHSEMVEQEIRLAHRLYQEQGKPLILPVRLAYRDPFQYPLNQYLDPINWAFWQGEGDTDRLITELQLAIAGGTLSIAGETAKRNLLHVRLPDPIPRPSASAQPIIFEMPEGTMDAESQFYVERSKDALALNTIQQQGVTITIKGPRQMGKSSLLNRTIKTASSINKRVILLDFQLFNKASRTNAEQFFRQFCTWLTDELELEDKVEECWQRPITNSQRCTRYVGRYLLHTLNCPLVLAMDEVERIFDTDFRTDFFSMLRSWHNQRATNPIWKQLDLILVTSTEPYQLIDDLNQSPFNVGQVLDLEDFTPDQVADLNQRHGRPLNASEEQRLIHLLEGHPYLVRRALYLVASQQVSSAELFDTAVGDRGPFGDHLRYHLFRMYDKQPLVQGMLHVIRHHACPDERVFFRLRGAGLVRRVGKTVLPRCPLYASYFQEHLNG